MKRLYVTIAFIAISFVAFLFVGCSKADNINIISTEQKITMFNDQTSLPQIFLNKSVSDWNNFYFENQDGYIYVYDGKIYLTETAPSEFETELNLVYKKDASVNAKLLVKKIYTPITSVSLKITNKRVYPGENVYYQIKYEPQNATLKNFIVEFDKPEYIDSQGDGYFKLKETTPLSEKIKIIITTDNNISCECEITVNNTVYEVYNVAQLKRMANALYGYFKLMRDIDFSESQWTPIQNFYGVLNGNGHTISGFEYKLESNSKNMDNNFGFIKTLNGVVRNAIFDDIDINIHKIHDNLENMAIGGVCGYMNNGELYDIKLRIPQYMVIMIMMIKK